jgi:hypothetical protein
MPLTEEFIHYHAVGKIFTGVLVRDSRNATLPGILLAPNMMGVAASVLNTRVPLQKKATLYSLPIFMDACLTRQMMQLTV